MYDLCLSKWSGVILSIAAMSETKYFEYSIWYDETSITKTVFLFIFFSDNIGKPIFPTNLASIPDFFNNLKIIDTTVDFPFVPVIDIFVFFGHKEWNMSSSLINL